MLIFIRSCNPHGGSLVVPNCFSLLVCGAEVSPTILLEIISVNVILQMAPFGVMPLPLSAQDFLFYLVLLTAA